MKFSMLKTTIVIFSMLFLAGCGTVTTHLIWAVLCTAKGGVWAFGECLTEEQARDREAYEAAKRGYPPAPSPSQSSEEDYRPPEEVSNTIDKKDRGLMQGGYAGPENGHLEFGGGRVSRNETVVYSVLGLSPEASLVEWDVDGDGVFDTNCAVTVNDGQISCTELKRSPPNRIGQVKAMLRVSGQDRRVETMEVPYYVNTTSRINPDRRY